MKYLAAIGFGHHVSDSVFHASFAVNVGRFLATAWKVPPSPLSLPLLSLLFTIPLISYFSYCPPFLSFSFSPLSQITVHGSEGVCIHLARMSAREGVEGLPASDCAWPPPWKNVHF